MNKCEWCEEKRYTSIISTKNMNSRFNALYCLDLHEDEKGYFMEIDRQKPPQVYWEILFRKQINYCPFCGRKLEKEVK